MRPAPLDPVQDAVAGPAQGRYVLGQQNQAQGQHPDLEQRKHAQEPAADQQHAGGEAKPARRGSA